MRTNIVIDDDLMQETLALTGLKTKREAVEAAMRSFVQLRRQAEIRELRGQVQWEGNLNEMRTDKVR